jgi:hypothetical protein
MDEDIANAAVMGGCGHHQFFAKLSVQPAFPRNHELLRSSDLSLSAGDCSPTGIVNALGLTLGFFKPFEQFKSFQMTSEKY